MPRRKFPTFGYRFQGRKRTAKPQSWDKQEWIDGLGLVDTTPLPGHTYTRYDWPPRGRGRGESLLSPRRLRAKMRAARVMELRAQSYTWQAIARATGFRDASGPYRAYRRALDRLNWDEQRREHLRKHAKS